MRNIALKICILFLTLVLTIISYNAYSQQTEYEKAVYEIERNIEAYKKIMAFDSLYSIGNYQEAFKYTPDIVEFYVRTEQYDECIDFCNSAVDYYIDAEQYEDYIAICNSAIHNDSTIYTPLNSLIGECLYYKKDYRSAELYLGDYVKISRQNGYSPGLYYIGLYANTLYELHKYSVASEYYKQYFDLICNNEDISINELPNSEHYRNYVDYKLYHYAYCHFFLGKENEGLNILKISADCNYEDAVEDYNVLKKSQTFGKDIKDINYTRKAKRNIRQYSWEFSMYDSLGKKNKEDFWDNVSTNCYELQELLYALNKNRIPNTLRGVLNEFNQAKISTEHHLEYLNPYETSDFESELIDVLCGQNIFLKELRVYNAQEPNAFATPWGQIYLTDALVYKYNFKKELLLAVCAHEVAHYICQHSITHSWNQVKKERNNEIWAGVAVGVNTATHAASSIYAASQGVQYDYDEYWEDVTEINNSLIDAFQENTYYYQFKYSRRQEIEADILAYRFCEYIGIGGYAYIMALELLGDNTNSTATSDHPSNALRIGILKNIYNKEKERMANQKKNNNSNK